MPKIISNGQVLDIPIGGSSTSKIEVDSTLTKNEDGIISVATPVQSIMTRTVFNALPEEQRNKGMYVVHDETSITSVFINGEEHVIDDNLLVSKVVLVATEWANNQQVVTEILTNPSKQLAIPVFAPDNKEAYDAAGIVIVRQDENGIIFQADVIPEEDLIVYVIIIGINEQLTSGAMLKLDDTLIRDQNSGIGVAKPSKFLSQEDYDDLTEEEKTDGTVYMTPQHPYLPMTDNGAVPTGAVVSFLAKKAPVGYLICDGTEYEIAKYPRLARFIENQFEVVNFFGGDGETTFAVPDMRNLFLRGYHGEAEEQISGEIGEKQEGTLHQSLNCTVETDNSNVYINIMHDTQAIQRADTLIYSSSYGKRFNIVNHYDVNTIANYTSRPVNMAVLYCIKY